MLSTIFIVAFFKINWALGSDYSKLDLCSYVKPTSTRAPQLYALALPTSDFSNPTTYRDSRALAPVFCDLVLLD
jgi:hypothetical protein